MSDKEKRFIVVSPSHHKKPRTMFLNYKISDTFIWWCDAVPHFISLWSLPNARAFAASSPVAIWFIEDKDWISSLAPGDKPKFADILKYAQKSESEIIRYEPEDMIPSIVAPSERQLADDTKVLTLPKEEERREKLVLTNCNGEFLVDRESLLFFRFVNKAVLFDSKQQIDEFLVEKGASGEFRFNTLLIADAEMVIAEGSRYSWALFEKALIPLSLPEHELAPHLFE